MIAVVALVAVEGVACGLITDRRAVHGWWRRSSVVAVIVVSRRVLFSLLLPPTIAHPASSVHGGHSATAATTAVDAPVRFGQLVERKEYEVGRQAYEKTNPMKMINTMITTRATHRPQLSQEE